MTKFEFIQSIGLNPQFVSLVMDTPADLVSPKSNPFNGLQKITYRLVICNFIYERSVIAQLEREGKSPDLYVSGGRRNGLEYFKGSKCLMHNKDFSESYLWVKIEKILEYKYMLNSEEIPETKLIGYLREKSSPMTQEPLDKKIEVRNIKLSNIISITANGQIYY